MALILNEEQQMLKEAASGFLQDKAPVAQLRELRDSADERGYKENVWKEMVDMGWAGIAIPEQYGGVGYGYTGLGIVLEEVGKNLSASPLNASVLAAATVILKAATEAQKEKLLPALASGELNISLALEENGQHKTTDFATTATQNGDAYLLNGEKRFVADAASADQLIVAASTDKGAQLFLVDVTRKGVATETVTMIDSRNSARVSFDNVEVSAGERLGDDDDAGTALSDAIDIINVGISAELLGISLRAFEMTIDYLKERKQFDAVIGTFQGLQHRAAHLFCEIELGKSMVLKTLQAIDAGEPGVNVLASATKAKMCEVAQLASNEGIQMHGGIGMTDEYDMGFYIKRARALEHSFGDRNYHLDRFAALSAY
ncbi:MAG: acyl-CoA dehydrogenase family protein [Pseudomonadales bacterium]